MSVLQRRGAVIPVSGGDGADLPRVTNIMHVYTNSSSGRPLVALMKIIVLPILSLRQRGGAVIAVSGGDGADLPRVHQRGDRGGRLRRGHVRVLRTPLRRPRARTQPRR
jgi:hypothetical protein